MIGKCKRDNAYKTNISNEKRQYFDTPEDIEKS